MLGSKGADGDSPVEGDDGDADVGADVVAGGGADAICVALVGDDADDGVGAAEATAGPDDSRSERRRVPSEPML